jgi:hypothetical protein
MYSDKNLYGVILSIDGLDTSIKKYVWAESDIQARGYAGNAYDGDVEGILNLSTKPYVVESEWGVVDHSKEPPTMIDADVVHVPAGIEFGWTAPEDSRTSHLSTNIDEETFAKPSDTSLSFDVDINVDANGEVEVTFEGDEDEG